MAITKEALLKLKVEGFDKAEAIAKGIAAALGLAQVETKGATGAASRLGPALAPAIATAQRIAEQLGIVGARARGANQSFVEMERSLRSVAARGDLAQVFGGMDRLRAAANRVRLGGDPGAGPSGTAFAAMKLRAMRAGGAVPGQDFGGGAIAGLGGALSRLAGPAAAAAAAVYAVKRGGEALFASIGRGERIAQIAAGFDRLSSSVGGSAAVMAALERATGGGVAKTELMTAANRLLVADLGISRERMEKLVEAGTRLGKSLGFTATESIDRMSLALAKQEPELLDELGLKVDLTKAIHDYAAAAKIDVQAVDAQTRARLFLEAVEKQALERAGKLGATITAAAAPTEALAKKWSDFSDRIAKFVKEQPGFIAALEAIAGAAMRITAALEPMIVLAGKAASALAPLIAIGGHAVAFANAGLASMNPLTAPAAPGMAEAALRGAASDLGMGGAGGSGGGRGGGMIDLSPCTIAALARALRGESPLANAFGG